jgi:hypothetical protein
MPPLIRFLLKWTAIGALAGWLMMAALILFDVGGIGGLLARSSNLALALFIMAMSFAVTFSQVTVLAAVLLRSDFGGTGGTGNARLDRWKAGHSAELDRDQPLP